MTVLLDDMCIPQAEIKADPVIHYHIQLTRHGCSDDALSRFAAKNGVPAILKCYIDSKLVLEEQVIIGPYISHEHGSHKQELLTLYYSWAPFIQNAGGS